MKKIFYCFLLMIVLTSCQANEEKENVKEGHYVELNVTNYSFESSLWDSIVGKEYSNYDNWAGEGIYFYEEDGIRYYDYMIYGSGVRVAGMFTNTVEEDEEGNLIIQIPEKWIKHSDNPVKVNLISAELVYEKEQFILNNKNFAETEHPMHEDFYDEE